MYQEQQSVTQESASSLDSLIASASPAIGLDISKGMLRILEDVQRTVHSSEARLLSLQHKVSELDKLVHKVAFKNDLTGWGDSFKRYESGGVKQRVQRQRRSGANTRGSPRNSLARLEECEQPRETPAERFRQVVLKMMRQRRKGSEGDSLRPGASQPSPRFAEFEAPMHSPQNSEKRAIGSEGEANSFERHVTSTVRFEVDPRNLDKLAEDPPSPRVFLPDSWFRRTWDVAYLVALLWECCIWSLVIFTSDNHNSSVPFHPFFFVMRVVAFLFWCVDLVVQMHTAHLDGWSIVEDPGELKHHFVRKRLPFEGLITFPFDLIASLAGEEMLSYYLMSLRVLRLLRVPWLFSHSTPTRETSRVIESIIFSFWLCLSVQICSCIWMSAATPQEQTLEEHEIGDLYTEYSKAMYFIWTTLSSVGYGDISPLTNNMRAYNVFLQLLGLALIMLVSGRTGAYFITTDPYKLVLIDRKRRLEHLMAHANVPWHIQKEAFTIYPSLLDASTKDYQSMLMELPEFIQVKISTHIKIKLIGNVPMFRGVSKQLLMHLANAVEEEYHGSKEYLIRAGEVGEEMYFLNHGIVEVLIPDDEGREIWAATLKAGSWFGEIALLKRTTRIASVRSITSCILFRLTAADMSDLLSHSEELRVRMQEETDRRLKAAHDVKNNSAGPGGRGSVVQRHEESCSKIGGVVGSLSIDKRAASPLFKSSPTSFDGRHRAPTGSRGSSLDQTTSPRTQFPNPLTKRVWNDGADNEEPKRLFTGSSDTI